MPHVEHVQRPVNLDVDIVNTPNNELLDLTVPRGYRGTLVQMMGQVMMTQSPVSTITAKFAIIQRQANNVTINGWDGVMAAGPVWIGILGVAMNGAATERIGINSQMSMDKVWRHPDVVSIAGTAPNNTTRGWLLMANSTATMTIQGGAVVFMDLEWLGGKGNPNELSIEEQEEEEMNYE